MKTYKEITEDIKSVISSEVSGTQLDILVGILSMYAYDIQNHAVSQLLENNLDTAININSIIAKAAQNGVSVPRITCPEVEFEVKSIRNTFELQPGDEVISINKFKFLFLGYYDSNGEYQDMSVCRINSSRVTIVRCLVTDSVSRLDINQIPGVIYDYSVTNVASKIFVYKGNSEEELLLMNQYNKYSDFLTDTGVNKVNVVTYPDYSVKIIDENEGDKSYYKVILPGGVDSVTEIIPLIKGKFSSKDVTIGQYRNGTTNDQNIKIINLGEGKLSRDKLVEYVELNLKLTQLIKSNTDINAFFSDYLYNLSNNRYNISYILGSELNIYVDDIYFNERLYNIDKEDLLDRFYINLTSININPGIEIIATISIELNNLVDDDFRDTISSYVGEYDGKFNIDIDEFDLITKINSVNNLIHLTNFSISYKAIIPYNNGIYEVKLSKELSDGVIDIPDLHFTEIPDTNNTYLYYSGKDKFLTTEISWT